MQTLQRRSGSIEVPDYLLIHLPFAPATLQPYEFTSEQREPFEIAIACARARFGRSEAVAPAVTGAILSLLTLHMHVSTSLNAAATLDDLPET